MALKRLFVVVFCVFVIATTAQSPSIQAATPSKHFRLVADIDPDQQVPPVNSTFSGVGVFHYNGEEKLLQWTIVHDVVNPTMGHFHGPAERGQNAGVVIPLALDAKIEGEQVLTQEQEDQLLAGLWYVNIHTAEHPGGVIRGQIEKLTAVFEALLTPLPSVNSAAEGTAVFKYHAGEHLLSYRIEHTVQNPTEILIHEEDDDDVLVRIESATSPVEGTVSFSSAQEKLLLDEHLFVTVTSSANPHGEIRGEILLTGEGTFNVDNADDLRKHITGSNHAGAIAFFIIIGGIITVVVVVAGIVIALYKSRKNREFRLLREAEEGRGTYQPPDGSRR